ncbi:MAG TPA: DUF1127 domain-containing protein [Dongiaceae bacterium]|nr:DUF1127 domain-containing protein [Dongiaceae bacterium]
MALVHSGKYAVESRESTRWRWFTWLKGRLQAWRREADDRHYLAGLNDHNLRDLGISRHDVDRDAALRDRFW